MNKKTLITLDFESYYDQHCNIKKLGTSQYVAHPDFHLLSVGVKTPGSPARAIGGANNVARLVESIRDHADSIVLCGHNLYFDAYILRYHFNFTPSYLVDTLCMAQNLHAHEGPLDLDTLSHHYTGKGKVPDVLPKWKGLRWEQATPELRRELLHYNEIDVERTEEIAIPMLQQFPKSELDVIDLTLRMFVDPVLRIDAPLAKEIYEEQVEVKAAAAAAAGTDQETLRSNAKFFDFLTSLGYDVPEKWSEKQAKMIPAVAKGDLSFQRFEAEGDEQLKTIIQSRMTCKSSIVETRSKALLERADRPFPVGLMYCSAHTMRWGGTDKVNMQNLPREGRLRHCIQADKGHTLVIVDASQIEARDNAVFSEQWDLVDAFARGEDVYCQFAEQLYGYPVNKDDNWEERYVGKTCILGLGYQMGVPRFKDTLETGQMGPKLEISDEAASRAVSLYRSTYPMIKKHWSDLSQLIPALLPGSEPYEHRGVVFKPDGRILMPNGLHLHYPGLNYRVNPVYDTPDYYYMPFDKKYRKPTEKKLYGGALLENLVQCRARIMTTEHMMKISKYYRVVMMAHDEVVLHVSSSRAEKALADSIEIMSEPPKWNDKCPLAAEGSISDHYIKD